MSFHLAAGWLTWAFGAGLAFVFLWLISVPTLHGGHGGGTAIE